MIPFTLTEVAAVTRGTPHLPDPISEVTRSEVPCSEVLISADVVTDSRLARPGSLYVARIGEHADGHDFASAARDNGAVATLGSRPIPGMPTVVVDDVQQAFADLARAVVDRAGDLQIIGITGSSGKTSTKDMLGQVLAAQAPTVAPEGSLNSEVGVPLTVCRITEHTRYLVAEMGASGVGHIAYLTNIAPPQVGIVLNVGTAHVGEFGSVEAIASTKSELVQALPSAVDGGVAILNADDPRVLAMAERTNARTLTVGLSESADLRASDVHLDAQGRASFTLDGVLPSPHGDVAVAGVPVQLALNGAHQVGNALAVIAAASAVGADPTATIAGLATAGPVSRWRMEVHDLPDAVTVINDAYNANPESMAASLRALAAIASAGGAARRRVAVLGAMRELGAQSPELHEQVGRLAADLGTDVVLAIGEAAAEIADGAGEIAARVADVEAAYSWLAEQVRPGDVVLFKSSRDSGLRYLGDRVVTDRGGHLPPG